MRGYNKLWQPIFIFFCIFNFLILNGCADNPINTSSNDAPNTDLPLYHGAAPYSNSFNEKKFASVLPQNVDYGHGTEKVILVDPKVFAWGAYDENGQLVKAGIATAGADFCPDEGKPCRTHPGTFHISSMGDEGCVSRTYPLGKGGALMPYCMFFNGGQSLHGSPDPMLVEANISHGCIHMRIPDAEWLRYNFADVGTKVVVLPY